MSPNRHAAARGPAPVPCAALACLLLLGLGAATACSRRPSAAGLAAAEAPPPLRVVAAPSADDITVPPGQPVALATAAASRIRPQLEVTGSIVPDVARTVPVVSLASGRVLEVDARLGDRVRKGQLLLTLQSADIADAAAAYRNALADAQLAASQWARARDLYAHGAVARGDLEIARNTLAKAQTAVTDAAARLRVLGVADPAHATGLVELRAPIAGVITDQQVTTAAGLAGLSSPTPFTISDLSSVWVLCDVYENELPAVQLGERARIRLDAYPGQSLVGRVSNIGAVLDPALRTAKVRIELRNPGNLRPGMFVTATLEAGPARTVVAVPSTAIAHLHDRDWVFAEAGDRHFRRLAVVGGALLPDGMQAVTSGLEAGQVVVRDALQFSAAVAQPRENP